MLCFTPTHGTNNFPGVQISHVILSLDAENYSCTCRSASKRPCTAFFKLMDQCIRSSFCNLKTYGIYIPGKRPCRPKSRVMFKHPWTLTWDMHYGIITQLANVCRTYVIIFNFKMARVLSVPWIPLGLHVLSQQFEMTASIH